MKSKKELEEEKKRLEEIKKEKQKKIANNQIVTK